MGRITKALTGYYSRQLQALLTHYLRVGRMAPGHLDYERFIMVGQQRTGSPFLHSLLNSHNQIVAFGDIYRRFDATCWDYGCYQRYASRHQLSAFQDYPIGFLEIYVFAKLPKGVSAVGFKLFYGHARHMSKDRFGRS